VGNKIGVVTEKVTTRAGSPDSRTELKNRHLTGEVRCLRSALRACAGRESRRTAGNVTARGGH
jgi:hypothetical protein